MSLICWLQLVYSFLIRKREEKEEFALLAQEIMFREKEKDLAKPYITPDMAKNDVNDELNMSIFSPITCLTVPDDQESSGSSDQVKTEPCQPDTVSGGMGYTPAGNMF